jgi:hypothetical protein
VSYEKNNSKKYAHKSLGVCEFFLKYGLIVKTATLDCMISKCSKIATDGEETQKQIEFTVLFTIF